MGGVTQDLRVCVCVYVSEGEMVLCSRQNKAVLIKGVSGG